MTGAADAPAFALVTITAWHARCGAGPVEADASPHGFAPAAISVSRWK